MSRVSEAISELMDAVAEEETCQISYNEFAEEDGSYRIDIELEWSSDEDD